MRQFLLWLLLGVCTVVLLVGCASDPPQRIDNVCSIFQEKRGWYVAAQAAEQRWGSPVAVLMAIMRHESAFQSDAKPPRKWYLGVIPGGRLSSAYGYSQALDGTWESYQQSTGQWGNDRDDFEAAIDFIGWYNEQSFRHNKINKSDAYNLYLAYHQGQRGYKQGRYRNKPAVIGTAKRVQQQANRYEQQLMSCRAELEQQGSSWWPFS